MNNIDYDLRSVQEARDFARKGKIAADQISDYTEEQIDKILLNIVRVAEQNKENLAELAVEETGFGKASDKVYKNHMASTIVYDQIKDMKTIGVIKEDKAKKVISIAEPIGLVMGILPSTNPTSTAIYKSIIAIKSRNSIVFSPHPGALKCTRKALKLVHDAAVEAGAPVNIVSCLETLSLDATNELMTYKDVGMIIATGGPGMVKAAYSSGKPALGVGAGNSPAYIEKTANIHQAVKDIISSKTFDNGTICSSEQSIIVEESNRDQVISEFKNQGCYFMTEEENKKVCNLLFKGQAMNPKMVGKTPQVIAETAGIAIPEGTKILLGEQFGVGLDNPLSFEKLTTVLAFYTVRDWKEAYSLSIELLQNGLGHTMSIHSNDDDMVMKFAEMPASRILVNTGGTQGGTGLSTGLMPAFTLGCGTWGGSSTSENVSPMHLMNIKNVTYGIKNCSTLAEDDSTFTCSTKNQSVSTGICEYQSPANYAAKTRVNAEDINSNKNKDNGELLGLMEEFLASMKGAN